MTDQSNEELVAGFVADHRLQAIGDDVFAAPTSEGSTRLYGGALLSRGAVATALTVDGKFLHSFHAYFLSMGQPGAPLRLEVTRTRDGRSYSSRAVRAVQGDRVLCAAMANFTALQDIGEADFQQAAPAAPSPESTPDGWALLKDYPHVWMPPQHAPFETRYVDLPWLNGEPPGAPWRIWVRSRAPLPDDPIQHLAACVMTSDMRTNGVVERLFGMALDPEATTISLDHTITFHRPARMDDWLLFVTWCTSAVAGRAYMYRQVYTRGGDLLMTITQEMAYRDIVERTAP